MELLGSIYIIVGFIVGFIYLFRVIREERLDMLESLVWTLSLAVIVPFWPYFLAKMMTDK